MKPKIFITYGILVISIVLILLNAEGTQEGSIGSSPIYNVILIIIDSLRTDHLSCYGYFRKVSPNIDRLATEGIFFEEAIAQSYWTLPSLASIFTSKYVRDHGVYDTEHKLSDSELTIAEILKLFGYKTAAFTTGRLISSHFGFNQGFDLYHNDTGDSRSKSFEKIMPQVIEWLEVNKNSGFFLFLHINDTHSPYHCPYEDIYDPDYKGVIDNLYLNYRFLQSFDRDTLFLDKEKIKLTRKDINHIIAHYDGGITYTDRYIGGLLKKLDELGLTNKTILILTADHGEELADHYHFGHLCKYENLYNEVLHVPLIIVHPNINLKGKIISNQVQLIDIMPTILDFLGIPLNKEACGLSLVSLIEDKTNIDFNRYVYSEATKNKLSIRTSGWKLIYSNGKYELYNLRDDPRELNNLIGKEPNIILEFIQRLFEWSNRTGAVRDLGNQIQLSEELMRKLRDVGYW